MEVAQGGETDDSQPVRRAKKLNTFGGRLTQNVGAQIKRWRRERKLTAQRLSELTEQLGEKIPRTVIINLENQRRDYVSLAEILILAAGLNIPPYLLIAPVGLDDAVEILPEVQSSPWRTRGWLMGALPVKYEGFAVVEWNDATVATKLYDKHRLLVRSYEQATTRLQDLDDDRTDTDQQQRQRIRALMLRQLASYLDQIRAHRHEIAQRGFKLPALDPEIEADLAGNPDGVTP
jgi:transcriptional regulator with XRE-family HTH domain